jgi:hypothetical protein
MSFDHIVSLTKLLAPSPNAHNQAVSHHTHIKIHVELKNKSNFSLPQHNLSFCCMVSTVLITLSSTYTWDVCAAAGVSETVRVDDYIVSTTTVVSVVNPEIQVLQFEVFLFGSQFH